MTFKQWLRQYSGNNTHVIDFADDTRADKHFPHKIDYAYILHYLEDRHAGDAQIRSFNEAWELYAGYIPSGPDDDDDEDDFEDESED